MTASSFRERAWRFFSARFEPGTALGLELTVGAIVVASCVWWFSALVEAVLDGATLVQWDRRTDVWVHARTTSAGDRIFQAVTLLGSPGAPIVAVIVAILLWKRRDWLMLIVWTAAILGGEVIEGALKMSVHRQRPPYAIAYIHDHSWSFPSAHTLNSVLAYATLAWLLTVRWPPARRRPWAVFLPAGAIIAFVAISRVYLGVHYPSDVVGGLLAGTGWVAICATVAGVTLRRGARVSVPIQD